MRADEPSRVVTFRMTPSEIKLAAEAAQANSQLLSEFIRDAILTAAGDCLELKESEKP